MAQEAPESSTLSRRTLLTGTAALGALVAVGAIGISRSDQTTSAQDARSEILRAVADNAFVPSTGEFDDIDGISQFITPIGPSRGDEFYVLDIALQKPQIAASDWSLAIRGPHVNTPLRLTYDDLLERDLITAEVTLPCISNPVGGELVANAFWTGVPLAELLTEAGLSNPTTASHQVFCTAADGYSAGFPLPRVFDGRTAMVALGMNGEPLTREHGFPARLLVAGMYADVSSTKWLTDIEVTDWVGVDGYWQPRGWNKDAPIQTHSRIDTPADGTEMISGPNAIAGVAWNPALGIERVEVGLTNIDEPGTTQWRTTDLAHVESDETWIQWRYEWDAPVGTWSVAVRATDKSGFTQSPEIAPAAPNGAEGHHHILLRIT